MSGCAVGPNGGLLPADAITWFHDADDDTPLSVTPQVASFSTSRPVRRRIPAAKLLGDNAEPLILTSHQQAICAQQEWAGAKSDVLAMDPTSKHTTETAFLSNQSSALGSSTETELSGNDHSEDDDESENPRHATAKSE